MAHKDSFNYKFSGEGLTPDEKKWGQKRFNEYRDHYPHLNKSGTLSLLEELVWKECLQDRFKQQVGLLNQKVELDDKGQPKIQAIPGHLQSSITEGLDQIIELKTKLGMFEDQKTLDAFKEFQQMKDKAAEYRKTHPLSFKCTCPYCAGIFFLKRRTENYEPFISPFIEDKILVNRPLFKLWKDGKVTKEEVADVLGVSPWYVDWLDAKVFGNVKKESTPETPSEPTQQ